MNLDLLDTPVRLTWDILCDEPAPGQTLLADIAERIVEAGVFFVSLQGQPLLHENIGDVVKPLAGRCRLSIHCKGDPAEAEILSSLPQTGVQVLLDTNSFVLRQSGVSTERLERVVTELRDTGVEPVLSLTPLRQNLSEIPDLIRFCADLDISKIKLPNAHIGASFAEYSPALLPRAEDLEGFRDVWHEFRMSNTPLPAMEIHDLFLWEIMTPGEKQNRSEYGGCQAGNSLGHIDQKGVVHPCAAWPHPLGTLPAQTLESVWSSKERQSVCEKIASTPVGCNGCRDLHVCFGGCRGLALHLNRRAGERDLMCSGPRK